MNEASQIRQQLRAERLHLREMLERMRQGPGPAPRPLATFVAWSARRLLEACGRHLALLPDRLAARGEALPPAAAARIDGACRAAAASLAGLQASLDAGRLASGPALQTQLPGLERLLAAWDEDLEALAAGCYRVEDWRRVAQLSADLILTERRLYGAARA